MIEIIVFVGADRIPDSDAQIGSRNPNNRYGKDVSASFPFVLG